MDAELSADWDHFYAKMIAALRVGHVARAREWHRRLCALEAVMKA